MPKLELVRDEGWILTLEPGEESIGICKSCKKKINMGYYCRDTKLLWCKDCEALGRFKCVYEGRILEHEHINIIEIKQE